jgi:hypothetical protein
MSLEDWQQRVVNEQIDLTNKIILLTDYIKKVESKEVTKPASVDLLKLQLEAMSSYKNILDLRIVNFN